MAEVVSFGGDPTNTGHHRRRAIIAAVVCGLTLLGLLVAVFSLVDAARRVTTDSAELHLVDGTLRQLDAAKTQVASVVVLGAFQEGATPEAIAGARTSLATLAALVEGGDDADVNRVVSVGNEVVSMAELKQFSDARETIDADLLPAVEAAQERLQIKQAERLDQVVSANEALRRFGAVGGFLVAFVVPTVGVFIFREISRRPKVMAEVEATYVLDREERARQSQFVAEELHDLREDVDKHHFDPDRLRRLDDLIRANKGSMWTSPEEVDLDALLAEVLVDLGGPQAAHVSGMAGIAWCDREGTRTALRSILGASLDRGSSTIDIVCERRDDPRIWINDNGHGIDAQQVREHVAIELAGVLVNSSGGQFSWGDDGRWTKIILPPATLASAQK